MIKYPAAYIMCTVREIQVQCEEGDPREKLGGQRKGDCVHFPHSVNFPVMLNTCDDYRTEPKNSTKVMLGRKRSGR